MERPTPKVDRPGPHGGSDDPGGERRELELVRAIQAGDPAAWSALLAGYQDRLFGVCFRMLGDRERAADCTQDAMVRIIEGLGTYDSRSKLSTWMIRVTMNVCLSRLRSDRVRRHASLEEATQPSQSAQPRPRSGKDRVSPAAAAEQTPVGRVQHSEMQERVAAALQHLAADQRAILVLRDCRGLDYEQIADVMDIRVGTVKSRLFRAREALREAIEHLDSEASAIESRQSGSAPDTKLETNPRTNAHEPSP